MGWCRGRTWDAGKIWRKQMSSAMSLSHLSYKGKMKQNVVKNLLKVCTNKNSHTVTGRKMTF